MRLLKKKAKEMPFLRRWHKPRGRDVAKPEKRWFGNTELRIMVTRELGPILSENFSFYIADHGYYCPSLLDAQEIIANSSLDRKTWVKDRFDCDDFAIVLKSHFAEAAYKDGERRMAHCFGIMWGYFPNTPHAINWMVNNDGVLRLVEPQTDEIFLPLLRGSNIWFMMV